MSRRFWVLLGASVLAAAALTNYFRDAASANAPALSSVAVTRGTVAVTVAATGTLQAVTTVEVGTQVSGTIKALLADFNSVVRRGQVIAQLEPSLFESQVEQARATVIRLEAEVDRARVQVDDTRIKLRRADELSARQLIPATDLETAQANARQADAALKAAEAQVVQARASLNQAQVNLGHATITAPIDGVVISRSVNVGQTVAASMQAPTLFVLARDLTRMQVEARVDEADIGRIEAGQAVTFHVDAYPQQPFTGGVRQVRLDPVVEQNVVSYVTVIDVPNRDLRLKPGMTASVSIEVAHADDVLKVPTTALRFTPAVPAGGGVSDGAPAGTRQSAAGRGSSAEGPGVWVIDGVAARRVPVQTGLSDGLVTAIIGGDVHEGDRVATGSAASGAAAGSSAAPATSPLLPRRPDRAGAGGRTGGVR